MGAYNDYIEQNEPEIMSDWQKYMVEINKVRKDHSLPSMIFSQKSFEEFQRQWVESRSI